MGSPVASAVSGPATELTKAICLLSGDHVRDCPSSGSGAFDLATGATKVSSLPSARTVQTPSWFPSAPTNAIDLPSGDQWGSAALALSPPTREAFWVATSTSQS